MARSIPSSGLRQQNGKTLLVFIPFHLQAAQTRSLASNQSSKRQMKGINQSIATSGEDSLSQGVRYGDRHLQERRESALGSRCYYWEP